MLSDLRSPHQPFHLIIVCGWWWAHRCSDFLIDECGANVNYAHGRQKRTALHWAARNGHADMVKHLAKRGANVQFGTADGVNALAWAVFSGDIDTCRVLLDLGVDPLARNRWKCGLGHWAGATGSIELCRWLADCGCGLCNAERAAPRWSCESCLERAPRAVRVAPRAISKHTSCISVRSRRTQHCRYCKVQRSTTSFSWLSAHPSSLSRSSSSGSQKNVWLLPKEFIMYFRTQGVVDSTEEWFALQDALFASPDICLLLRKMDTIQGVNHHRVGDDFSLHRFSHKQYLLSAHAKQFAASESFATTTMHPSEVLVGRIPCHILKIVTVHYLPWDSHQRWLLIWQQHEMTVVLF